jgi:hypothetical protein
MKRFALPLSLLVVLVFAQACTDATSPNPNALLAVTNPTLAGNVPPPPTTTVVTITVSSPVTYTAVFTGVYFANGGNSASVAAAAELDDPSLAFNGTAWLRLDNNQTGGNSVSANARFQLTDQRSSGHGTLFIVDADGVTHTIVIGAVTWVSVNPDCNAAFDICAVITFEATLDGEEGHGGTAEAFGCELREGEGGPYYFCPTAGS